MTSGWAVAVHALSALAIDPAGLGGMTVRARVSPVRQRLEDAFGIIPLPRRRIHPGLAEREIFGGLNVAASLAEGRAVHDAGLSETPSLLVMPMAERTPRGLAACLARLLDAGRHGLILLDESAEDEEAPAAALTERLAFQVDLDAVRLSDACTALPEPADLASASAALAQVTTRRDDAETLVVLAAKFGIESLRAPLMALRAARAFAALDRRSETNDEDIRRAAELIYPARARFVPDEPDQQDNDAAPGIHANNDTGQADPDNDRDTLDDMLVSAVAARLPTGVLNRLQDDMPARFSSGSGAGARRKGNRRGRPLESRPGRPDAHARIDVIATLRAAAPWQTIRRKAQPDAPGLLIRPGDIRLRRYEDRSDRLLIFVVDASGSAAMARMAEAKGAVESLLAEAYARRDHVALIAFRNTSAELLLPPTRSLLHAKRRLAGLPGGGGTPLAAGLRQALDLTIQTRRQGLSPAIALLTDGRANVTLEGEGNRAQALEDASLIAKHLAGARIPSVILDTGLRRSPHVRDLASALGADDIFLPFADARTMSRAVTARLGV